MGITNFTADVTAGDYPLTVEFTDLSSPTPSGWLWDFGDGQTSSLQNPTHTYNESGLYSVTLTITSPGGYTPETKTDYINVLSPPAIDSAQSYKISVQGGNVIYRNATPGEPVTVNVNGDVNVTDFVNIGVNSGKSIITSGPGQRIIISTGGAPIQSSNAEILPGASYANGTYTNVQLYGGNGSGARATLIVSDPTVSITITNTGNEYSAGDQLFVRSVDVGGSGTPLYAIKVNVTGVSGGNLYLEPSNALILNGITWPKGATSISPGQYIGSSNPNELNFYSFIIGVVNSDDLDSSQLDSLFPDAQAAQYVIGPTVMYMCIGSGNWRNLSGQSECCDKLPYDIGLSAAGTMQPTGTVLSGMILTRSVFLPSNGNHLAYSLTAPTNSANYQIAKVVSGVETVVGTINFPAASNNGTISLSSNITLNNQDLLILKSATAVIDPTMKDVFVTLTGCAEVDPCIIEPVTVLPLQFDTNVYTNYQLDARFARLALIFYTNGTWEVIQQIAGVTTVIDTNSWYNAGGPTIGNNYSISMTKDSETVYGGNYFVSPTLSTIGLSSTRSIEVWSWWVKPGEGGEDSGALGSYTVRIYDNSNLSVPVSVATITLDTRSTVI